MHSLTAIHVTRGHRCQRLAACRARPCGVGPHLVTALQPVSDRATPKTARKPGYAPPNPASMVWSDSRYMMHAAIADV